MNTPIPAEILKNFRLIIKNDLYDVVNTYRFPLGLCVHDGKLRSRRSVETTFYYRKGNEEIGYTESTRKSNGIEYATPSDTLIRQKLMSLDMSDLELVLQNHQVSPALLLDLPLSYEPEKIKLILAAGVDREALKKKYMDALGPTDINGVTRLGNNRGFCSELQRIGLVDFDALRRDYLNNPYNDGTSWLEIALDKARNGDKDILRDSLKTVMNLGLITPQELRYIVKRTKLYKWDEQLRDRTQRIIDSRLGFFEKLMGWD